jgi:hypothetical protein
MPRRRTALHFLASPWICRSRRVVRTIKEEERCGKSSILLVPGHETRFGPVVGNDEVVAAQLVRLAPAPTLVLTLSDQLQRPEGLIVPTMPSHYGHCCVGERDGQADVGEHDVMGCALAHARIVPECNYHDRRHNCLRVSAMQVTFSRRVLP